LLQRYIIYPHQIHEMHSRGLVATRRILGGLGGFQQMIPLPTVSVQFPRCKGEGRGGGGTLCAFNASTRDACAVLCPTMCRCADCRAPCSSDRSTATAPPKAAQWASVSASVTSNNRRSSTAVGGRACNVVTSSIQRESSWLAFDCSRGTGLQCCDVKEGVAMSACSTVLTYVIIQHNAADGR
jgi:hypothetical protein